MNCERCSIEHNGEYGSGRFCSSFCAHSFTTSVRRKEINIKVSKALKGRANWSTNGFKKGFDPNRRIPTDEQLHNARKASKRLREERYEASHIDELPLAEKRRRKLIEQDFKCLCGISEWEGKKLTLELDHINGNHSDDAYTNLRILCPNCHSLTPTFRNKRRTNSCLRGGTVYTVDLKSTA